LLIGVKLGVVTVCFGSTLWWILPDSPHTAKFLSERERVIAVERLKSNKTGVKNVHHKQYQVFEALKDIKVWMLVAAIFFHNMTNSLQTTVSLLVRLATTDVSNAAKIVRRLGDSRVGIQRRRIHPPQHSSWHRFVPPSSFKSPS
jgi:hypothetical protein